MSSHYIVYNVVERTTLEDVSQNLDNVTGLYLLLLKSNSVVNIEQHWSEDKLISELRVILWSEEEYQDWAKKHREDYDKLIENFNQYYSSSKNTVFKRFTSTDGYVSNFPYTYYPPKNEIISWTLIDYHLDCFVENIIPTGKMIDYKGNGLWEKSQDLTICRFLKERTSSIVRRPHNIFSNKGKIPTWLLMYSFDHALQTVMHSEPYVYYRFSKLTRDVEFFAEKFITDCDHSAVLVGHESLDDEFVVHTHRVTDENRLTLTIAVRITFNGSGLTYRFWDPISDDDPDLLNYYPSPALLKNNYTNHKSPHEFTIQARSSVLVFSGSHVPHSVTFDKDLYLFYVWDNVTFKPGVLDEIKKKSEHTFFEDQEEVKRLYFYNL
jgi:hypothetical protein